MDIPPSWAMAIAMLDSDTVSMAAETTGIFKFKFEVNRPDVSTHLGMASE